ncbi:MAG: restriction endonuclease subunit S, partial [Deltaproteobacteria bacterium]
MSVTWENRLLRDICQNVQYGHTASATDEPIGPKFLRITDIVPETIDWPSVPHCEIEPKKKGKYLLKKGDIVIARTGATTGYAKYIKAAPESIFASYLVRLQLINGVDPRYVGYVVESDVYKEFIQANWGGAAQPNANAQILTSFHVPTPPLPTQRKIAKILSAYDDLIENNLRRIKILEEMAQNLYREWFVKFRFPG